jgi:hypothetical protein
MEQSTKQFLAQNEIIKPSTAWLLFLLCGWSYGSMGSMTKQIFYYLTLGGLGVWAVYVMITLNYKIEEHNNLVYIKYGIK